MPELAWYCKLRGLSGNDKLFPVTRKTILVIVHQYTEATVHDFRRSMKNLWKNAGMDIVDRMSLSNQEQKIDGIYSAEINTSKLQAIYQKYYDIIFG